MAKRTPLYARHAALGAKLVDFGGWDMPLHYGSQLNEHHQVRRAAGLFDVSHMTIVDFADPTPTRALLRYLLANDVARLYPGKALYTCILNEAGGVIDDLIVYDRGETGYRLVLNAATRDKDLAWIAPIAERFGATWRERDDLAMLAAQGPEALSRLEAVLGADTVAAVRALKPFHALETDGLFIARTGYTGEDGVEILPPVMETPALWDRLAAAGIAPCGLGARDTSAAGGRHESVRQRHGRNHHAAGFRAGLDRGLGAGGSRLYRSRAHWSNSAPPVRRKPLSAWCWRIAACCAVISRSMTAPAKSARSPAALSRPH
jgi:aminomethyltransferase